MDYNSMQSDVLDRLLFAETEGMTYKDLSRTLKKGHGTISGALSMLHSEGQVFYLHQKRENCHIYVHSRYKKHYNDAERIDIPKKSKVEQYEALLKEIVMAYKTDVGLKESIKKAEKLLS
jgi:predicted transcriptional regulator